MCHFERLGTGEDAKWWTKNFEPFDWTVQDAKVSKLVYSIGVGCLRYLVIVLAYLLSYSLTVLLSYCLTCAAAHQLPTCLLTTYAKGADRSEAALREMQRRYGMFCIAPKALADEQVRYTLTTLPYYTPYYTPLLHPLTTPLTTPLTAPLLHPFTTPLLGSTTPLLHPYYTPSLHPLTTPPYCTLTTPLTNPLTTPGR